MSETTAEPLRGAELLRAAVNRILDHPEQWNQSQWHCGTKHCVFGWCQVLAGRPQSDETCFDEVKDLLGISDADAMWLSAPNRTLGEIHGYAAALLVGGDGYNRDGYNRDGYDRAGYNRDGYNRDGYDRAGYDRDGYDLAGRDRAGRDRAGRDRAGRDLAGRDLDGRDRAGRDRDGNMLPRL